MNKTYYHNTILALTNKVNELIAFKKAIEKACKNSNVFYHGTTMGAYILQAGRDAEKEEKKKHAS
jgi:hypothetical protein